MFSFLNVMVISEHYLQSNGVFFDWIGVYKLILMTKKQGCHVVCDWLFRQSVNMGEKVALHLSTVSLSCLEQARFPSTRPPSCFWSYDNCQRRP